MITLGFGGGEAAAGAGAEVPALESEASLGWSSILVGGNEQTYPSLFELRSWCELQQLLSCLPQKQLSLL